MEYVWKIIMRNRKEYLVLNETKNATDFVEKYFKSNSASEFKLVNPTILENGLVINYVVVRGDDISSVEYSAE